LWEEGRREGGEGEEGKRKGRAKEESTLSFWWWKMLAYWSALLMIRSGVRWGGRMYQMRQYDTPQIRHTGIRSDTPGKFDTLPHSGRCVENALGYH
jgi:hypothetical protein